MTAEWSLLGVVDGWELAATLLGQLYAVFWAVAPIWLFGAAVGLLLPRPKWLENGSRSSTLLLSTPAGSFFRRLALAYHASVIIREVWRYCTHPGTFHGLMAATWQWASGKGWRFQWPSMVEAAPCSAAAAAAASKELALVTPPAESPMDSNWYVGEKDLAFFKYHAVEGGPLAGASAWELMMDKDIPGVVRYTAWRRTLPGGKTEYKSVTVSPDATSEEIMDMHLDDSFRHNWDGMVIHHEVLEHGNFAKRQQVVRWIRRFPFSFLSDREYTMARCMVRDPDGDGSLYALSKALAGHPREVRDGGVVKMDVFWSMWRSRTVACPWGGVSPACETVLLHHEQFKIPENLARFAVRHGMWGFVRQVGATTPRFVQERRTRVGAHEQDPQAWGSGFAPTPPLARGGSSCSSLSSYSSGSGASSSTGDASRAGSSRSSECGSGDSWDGASDGAVMHQSHGGAGVHEGAAGARPGRRMRGALALLVAGGLAVALGGRGSNGAARAASDSAENRRSRRSGSSRRHERQHERRTARVGSWQ